jgi:FAD/FMN-containing dehydrogenase
MAGVDVRGGLVTAGAGTALGPLAEALAAEGLALPTGCGATVGIDGLTLGGGLGVLGRLHGLTCDRLRAAQVVLADGSIVVADARREPELLWAARGAGGAFPGVVTSLVLEPVPAPRATSFRLTWPPPAIGAVLDAWQHWAPDAPDALAASLLVRAGGAAGAPPTATLFGTMIASRGETAAQLDAVVRRAGVAPDRSELRDGSLPEAKAHLAEADAEGGADLAGRSRSEFFRRPLDPAAVEALVEHLLGGPPEAARELDLTPWGGAYNRTAPDATAFPHRRERFLLKHAVAVRRGAGAREQAAAARWLARSWELTHPFGSGGVYPNFPDPALRDPARAYHGANLARLTAVRRRYDPGAVI